MKQHTAFMDKLGTKFSGIPRRRFVFVTVGLVVCFYLLLAGLAIRHQPITFDEGWDLQAPLNLVRHGQYASLGGMWGGHTKIFDPYLSTGPSVMVPIAIMFKLFGVGALQARIVMIGFYVTVLCLISWYVYSLSKSRYTVIAALSILLLMAPTITFRLDVLGEFPAIAYTLASLIAWRRAKYAWAGVFAALAVLSKAIMLFLVAAAAVSFAIWLLRNWQQRKQVVWNGLRWVTGLAIPLVAWEIYKFIELGSYQAYKQNWREYIAFFKVTGSGLVANGTILTTHDKLRMIRQTIQMPRVLFALLVVVVIALVITKLPAVWKSLRAQSYGLLFVAFYLLWWFVKANGGFVRYVIPVSGIILALVWATALSGAQRQQRRTRWLHSGLAAVILILLLADIWHLFIPLRSPQFIPTLQTEQLVAQKINATNHSSLSHLGFWQNPEIEFLGNLHSEEQGLNPAGSTFDLLLSPTMKENVPADYQKGLRECQQIYFEQSGYVYCLAKLPQ